MFPVGVGVWWDRSTWVDCFGPADRQQQQDAPPLQSPQDKEMEPSCEQLLGRESEDQSPPL